MPSSLKTGYLWSFLFGIIFSFGWVPCVGMIFSAILLLASIFISFFSNFFKKINKHLNIISIISGIFLIILGILFLLDVMTKAMVFVGSWVPFLSKISI